MQKQMIRTISHTLGQDAVPALTLIEGQYSAEDALRVSLIIVHSLMCEILSPDVLAIAKWRTLKSRPSNISEKDYKCLIDAVFSAAEKIRQGNALSGMF